MESKSGVKPPQSKTQSKTEAKFLWIISRKLCVITTPAEVPCARRSPPRVESIKKDTRLSQGSAPLPLKAEGRALGGLGSMLATLPQDAPDFLNSTVYSLLQGNGVECSLQLLDPGALVWGESFPGQ